LTVALNTPAIVHFVGTGALNKYPVSFPTFEDYTLEVSIAGEDGATIPLSQGLDYVLQGIGRPNTQAELTLVDAANVPPGHTGPIPESQEWLDGGNLAEGYLLFVAFTDKGYQPMKGRDWGAFAPEKFERTMDRLAMNVKRLRHEVSKALRFSDRTFFLDGEPVTAEDLLRRVNELEALIEAFISTGGSLPPGMFNGAFLEGDESEDMGARWVDGAYEGFSARFNQAFSSAGLDDTIRKILDFAYLSATISLSTAPGTSVREKGVEVSAVTMNASTVKRTENILTVEFYRAGSLVHTVSSPNPNGGVESYVDNNAFTDNRSFYARVWDGTSWANSNTVSYPFVYPYYHGAGAPGRTAAQVAAMVKSVIASNANRNAAFTTSNGDVYYFAYPASYGALTSILDENSFEVISSWTLRIENITGLDGTAQSYRIYEFNNPVIAGSTSFTFRR
jgi:hypothetical protein